MSDKILDEPVLEDSAPITPDELIANLMQDITLDNSPADIADDFLNDFVLQDRPETTQILAMLETPSETLVELLKGIVGQSYQVQIAALNSRGEIFLDNLKAEVTSRMTELANDTA